MYVYPRPNFTSKWDPRKNASNKRKHGVSFAEAGSVFSDERALLLDDTEHSDNPNHFCSKSEQAGAGRIQRKLGEMKKTYDFSNARPNPYAKRLKKSVTIRLDQGMVEYFKELAEDSDIPYQTLINLYLRDCAAKGKRISMKWAPKRSTVLTPNKAP